ncbi:5'-methylthioadenosine/S-adenosylhomocysteine nucleosidase [Salisediminibacterium halotolerans]|uniref:5'-methylthioadenosine/S-adenosylhomocysteine nucleosidase n=1 Tax=Salisediminibacterium halotolerans TaxID=517425 RepID=A0A1H9V9A6_9BACI|nr:MULTISPECIES: 5'-methylthioadenosine/S-adenosylhomocysteine nucleosidase [Salisediminibacterium]RLJ78348.1 adenosylhomocysteine nucleosidase [Actinophytocola xinjiangensis]RPE88310.1 adenosylhomocysteine nucleosidase [Salisediminibacterium halotolerans]TWG37324.1 adenosylhomocysteine nucleosidase [Salisediminibacterium halotolerans]SES18366.1 adenosylhomocysteine nucleosidase [Salisediminibacterium haloalkalitolerans]GEL06789.1 5'-methylthioadenosine/S-adenosylhomocysteine nucleosidase [Sal
MRVGVIGAMEEEVEMLREKMDKLDRAVIAGCEFHLGKLEGVEVILAKSGIGKVNAAISTTLMNQLYHPDYIINTGSAGGLNPELEVGDVVVSTEVRYNDVDATVFGYEYGQVPRMPAFYPPDERLISIAAESAEAAGIPAAKGLIISGDSFMSNHDRVEQLKKTFNKPYCAEMEAGAIAHVCHQFQCPFVVIRSLSDIAGRDAKMSYDEFLEDASVNSANMVLIMLEELRKLR